MPMHDKLYLLHLQRNAGDYATTPDHWVLYNQSKGVAIDITNAREKNQAAHYGDFHLCPVEETALISRMQSEGKVVHQKRADGTEVRFFAGYIGQEELRGEQYQKLAEVMGLYQGADELRSKRLDSLREQLVTIGLIPKESNEPKPTDFDSLDRATRKRLEEIVENTVLSGNQQSTLNKVAILRLLGNEEKARQYEQSGQEKRRQSLVNGIEDAAAEIRKRNPHHWLNDFPLLEYFLSWVEGIEHPALELLQTRAYQLALREKKYESALELAITLHLPETELLTVREKLFYSRLTSCFDVEQERRSQEYVTTMHDLAKTFPAEKALKLAEKAYWKLGELWVEEEGTSYLYQAALLAREFDLGRENILAPIREYLALSEVFAKDPTPEYVGGTQHIPDFSVWERMIDDFDLPLEITRRPLREILDAELDKFYSGKKSPVERIIQRRLLPEEEIAELVRSAYDRNLGNGFFQCALGIRTVGEKCLSPEQREKISREDLALLAEMEGKI